MKITCHMKDEYTLCLNPKDAKFKFYTAFKTRDPRCKKPYDMCLQIGGQLYFILKDGTLVSGYNDFPKSELKKAYDFFNKTA